MPMEFVRVKVSARGFGGFANLLLETLERAGVNNDEVAFEGVTQLLPRAEGRDGLGSTLSFPTNCAFLSTFPGVRM
ncbi:unnamed protein product [Urochloa humidicola]